MNGTTIGTSLWNGDSDFPHSPIVSLRLKSSTRAFQSHLRTGIWVFSNSLSDCLTYLLRVQSSGLFKETPENGTAPQGKDSQPLRQTALSKRVSRRQDFCPPSYFQPLCQEFISKQEYWTKFCPAPRLPVIFKRFWKPLLRFILAQIWAKNWQKFSG